MTRINDRRTATLTELADALADVTQLLQRLSDAEGDYSRELICADQNLREVVSVVIDRNLRLGLSEIVDRCVSNSASHSLAMANILDNLSDQIATLSTVVRMFAA